MEVVIGLAAVGFVSMIGLIIAGMRLGTGDDGTGLQARLEEYAGREAPLSLEEIELSQPFSERILVPVLKRFAGFATRFTPAQSLELTRHKLELAGRPNDWGPAEFLGLRGLAAVLLGILIFLLLSLANQPFLYRFGFTALAALLGFFFPIIWLGRRIADRQKEVIKSLPDALDMFDHRSRSWDGLGRCHAKSGREMGQRV
jgi:tight adherence protein C